MRYQENLSGPLLDRIDIQLNLQPVTAGELLDVTHLEHTKEIERITRAKRATSPFKVRPIL